MSVEEFKKWIGNNKGIATWAVCFLGAYSMYISGGKTGIGWAILGIFLIWDN